MSPLITASTIVVIVLAVAWVIAMVMRRPVEWYRAACFGIGFAVAYLVNDHFQLTGLAKYLVAILVVIAFFYLGQYPQRRIRPIA